jgi:hypothetical protein
MSHKPTITFAGADSPADTLDNAAAVTRFLSEVAPTFTTDGQFGLSDKGAQGLYLILDGLEHAIEAAAAKL